MPKSRSPSPLFDRRLPSPDLFESDEDPWEEESDDSGWIAKNKKKRNVTHKQVSCNNFIKFFR